MTPGVDSHRTTADTPPRTILYVHASDELYGSDLMLLHLVRGLDRARFRSIIVLPTDLPYAGLLSAELRESGIAYLKLDLAVVRRRYLNPRGGLRFAARLLRSTAQLLALIRRERVALVQSSTLVVWPGALAALLARRPHVWHIHELLTGPAPLRRLIGRVLLALSTVVVSNSRATRAALFGPRAGRGRTPVIYNAVAAPPSPDARAVSSLRAAWGAGADGVLVGTVGRVSRRKGQRELLLAAEAVIAAAPQTRFIIVGGAVPGQEAFFEELRRQAESHKLAGQIVFTGFRPDIGPILDALDLIVAPVLLPESFGLAAAEALAHGKPVIASRLGGLAEVVADGETGVLVQPGNIAELAEAITRLAADKGLRARLGRAGPARIARDFTAEDYVARFVALYDRLL